MNFKLLSFSVVIISYVAPSTIHNIHPSPSMGQGSSIDSSDITIPRENSDGKLKVGLNDQSELLTAHSGEPVGLASRLNQLEAEFQAKIEELKAQTIRSSEDQEEKIAIIRVREQNLARLLNQTREEMVGLKTQNRDQSKRIDQLEQKLAMLQSTPPISSTLTSDINNKNNMRNGAPNTKGHVSKILTPPSSCQELAMLGYYLDGLYLVKNKETKKIQTVFCIFEDYNQVSQNLIGHADIKTKSVHFYVQRNSSFDMANAVMPFQFARLNEGGDFNLTSGVFTVKLPGIYHFDFSALKGYFNAALFIHLQVNGVNVGLAHTNHFATGTHNSISLSTSLRLAVGDKVNLFNEGGVLFDDNRHFTHFSGWLVEEDLM